MDSVFKNFQRQFGIYKVNYRSNVLQLESNEGIRFNVEMNLNYGNLNISHLLATLTHTDKTTINKRIGRWLRTKEGVWTIDSLLLDDAIRNGKEELVYEFQNQILWKHQYTDKGQLVIYPEFTDNILRRHIYDEESDYFDVKKVRIYSCNNLFWLENYDCFACYKVAVPLLHYFKVWFDNALDNALQYAYAEANRNIIKQILENETTDKVKPEFRINKGMLEYRIIEIETKPVQEPSTKTKFDSLKEEKPKEEVNEEAKENNKHVTFQEVRNEAKSLSVFDL